MAEPGAYFRCSERTAKRLSALIGEEGPTVERIRVTVGDRELDNPVVVSDEVPDDIIESWRDGKLLASIALEKHTVTANGHERRR